MFFLLSAIVISMLIASKSNSDKFGPRLKWSVENNPKSIYTVYVYLKDKGPEADKMLLNPLSLVTQRSLDRRMKVMPSGQLVEMSDVPVYANYLNFFKSQFIKLKLCKLRFFLNKSYNK